MTQHGLRFHPLYHVWVDIRQRCTNTNHKRYYGWGGRGIKVCEEWRTFKPFYDWAISNNWEKGLQIDRIDNDGNYEPSNCRFVTTEVNSRNKRNNKYVSIDGESKIIIDWANDPRCAVSYYTFRKRIYSGVEPKTALLSPLQPNKKFER